MTAPTLRPYQAACLAAIWKAYDEQRVNRILIQKATGLGKTVAFAALPAYPPIAHWLAQFPARERKMLVIAHREELLTQAADKIQRANPDLQIGIEQGDLAAGPFCDVIIASIQTLAAVNYRRLEKILRWGVPRIVIVDEAHHAAATTYRNCLIRLGFLPPEEAGESDDEEVDAAKLATILREWETTAPRDRILLGFTATPNRSDAVGLGCVFSTIAYTYPIKRAIDDGWLAPITPWIVDTKTSLDEVAVRRGEFDQRQLADAVNTRERNAIAVAAWQRYAAGRQTIAFTVDVKHAHDLAAAFSAAGIYANAISGETPKDHRRQLLADYGRGQFPVLTNCMVLTEGTDLPTTSCILHAKPTKSATLYEQMTGRGLRLVDGKQDCVVIDIVDVARRHSLQSAPVLYGLPPLKPEGKNLNTLADEIERFQEEYPTFDVAGALQDGALTLEQLRAKAKTFDIWAVPALGAVGAGLTLNWIKVGADTYRLQYPWGEGTEVLRVDKDMLGHYDVSCTYRPMGGRSSLRQWTVAAQVPSVEAALRTAESFVTMQRRDVTRLKDRDAHWRKAPASPKQIALLRLRRIPFRGGITKGEASDLLDMASARRGL